MLSRPRRTVRVRRSAARSCLCFRRSGRAAHTRVAYEALRERIASGGLGPGTWLREHTVATSLGLSRTPVREALRLLAAEGVVELVHNRGARVVSWSAEDIDEAYRLRALIEGYGAGLAGRAGRRRVRGRAPQPAGALRAGPRRAGPAADVGPDVVGPDVVGPGGPVQRRFPRRRSRRVRQRPAARAGGRGVERPARAARAARPTTTTTGGAA